MTLETHHKDWIVTDYHHWYYDYDEYYVVFIQHVPTGMTCHIESLSLPMGTFGGDEVLGELVTGEYLHFDKEWVEQEKEWVEQEQQIARL